MIWNYLTVAWRQLKRHQGYAWTNIAGLAVALAACLLIGAYIRHELQHDRHHAAGGRLYRVNTLFVQGGQADWSGSTPAPIGPALRADLPEVQQFARVLPMFTGSSVVQHADRLAKEDEGAFVDSSFFQLFTYRFLAGDPRTATRVPNAVVLPPSTARQLFGSPERALDQTVRIQNGFGDGEYRVTGVAEPAGPTHLTARMFVSMHTPGFSLEYAQLQNFLNNNMFYTYVLLQPNADPAQLPAKLSAFKQARMAADLKANGRDKEHRLQAVSDIHLEGVEQGVRSGYTLIYILGSVQLFILGIACFNFMNLATSRANQRAREVGVRKVSGATRGMIIGQFVSEGVLIALLALAAALFIVQVGLPLFNMWADVELSNAWLFTGDGALYLVALTVLCGVVSSLYPALYLSSFLPAKVLTGRFKLDGGSKLIRHGLVVTQFVAAVVLTVGVFVFQQQLAYTQDKQLGFARDNRLVIPLSTPAAAEQGQRLRNELARQPGVLHVSGASSHPGTFNPQDNLLHAEGKTLSDAVPIKINSTDEHFLPTLGIGLVAGRNFRPGETLDTNWSGVVNQATLRAMGYEEANAVGRTLNTQWGDQKITFTIVGVMADYHHQSLREPLRPMMLVKRPTRPHSYLIVQLAPGTRLADANDAFRSVFRQVVPDFPYESHLLNDDLQQMYAQEQRLTRVTTAFGIVAVLLACSGLFALASFTAAQRRKEISVRKVLGASMQNITLLLTRNFLGLVLLANAIGLPLAWWAASRWLEGFAYRTDLGWELALAALFTTLSVALFSVLGQSIRAAQTKPVEWLKGD